MICTLLVDMQPVNRTQRAAQKAKYRGEFFPANMTEGGSGGTFLSFFQIDRDTGDAKGIVRIDLGSLEP
jgi:hypothetical protein